MNELYFDNVTCMPQMFWRKRKTHVRATFGHFCCDYIFLHARRRRVNTSEEGAAGPLASGIVVARFSGLTSAFAAVSPVVVALCLVVFVVAEAIPDVRRLAVDPPVKGNTQWRRSTERRGEGRWPTTTLEMCGRAPEGMSLPQTPPTARVSPREGQIKNITSGRVSTPNTPQITHVAAFPEHVCDEIVVIHTRS